MASSTVRLSYQVPDPVSGGVLVESTLGFDSCEEAVAFLRALPTANLAAPAESAATPEQAPAQEPVIGQPEPAQATEPDPTVPSSSPSDGGGSGLSTGMDDPSGSEASFSSEAYGDAQPLGPTDPLDTTPYVAPPVVPDPTSPADPAGPTEPDSQDSLSTPEQPPVA